MHKKYVRKKGRKFGPYFYTTIRGKDGIARSYYLSQDYDEALRKEEELKEKFLKEKEGRSLFMPQLAFAAIIIAFSCAFLFLGGGFTGMFVSGDAVQYTQELGMGFTQSSSRTIELEAHPGQFYLSSLSLSGKVIGSGNARVYIESPSGERYLVLSHSPSAEGLGLTGMATAIGNGTINTTEEASLPEGNTTLPEDNTTAPDGNTTLPEDNATAPDGNTTLPEGNVTINGTGITVPEENATTNITGPIDETNVTIPGEDTAANMTEPANETNATLPDVNATLPEENVTVPEDAAINMTGQMNETGMTAPEGENMTAPEEETNATAQEANVTGPAGATEYPFSSACFDTCLFTEDDGFTGDSYLIIIELDEGTELVLEKMDYSAREKAPLAKHAVAGVEFKRTRNDPTFDVIIESAELDEGELIVRFRHDSPIYDQPVSIDGPVTYDLTHYIIGPGETASLIVHGWKNGKFSLVVGEHPGEVIVFGSQKGLKLSAKIKDASGRGVAARADFIDPKTRNIVKTVTFQESDVYALPESFEIEEGIYDIDLVPEKHAIKKIGVKHAGIEDNLTGLINIDEIPPTGGFVRMYAIDPTPLSFSSADVTVEAKGDRLYKCAEWDFQSQACGGDWVFLRQITPGEDYNFTLTPEDPAFGEVLQPGDGTDTFVNQRAPDTNYGASMMLAAGEVGGDYAGILIKFDVSHVPSSANITSSRLRMYFYESSANPENQMSLSSRLVTSDWDESAVTWNTRPGYTSQHSDKVALADNYGWVEWDVSEIVQRWVNGSNANYGIAIVPDAETASADKRFYSSDYSDSSLRPALEVNYTTEPPQISVIWPINNSQHGDGLVGIGYNVTGGEGDIASCSVINSDNGNIMETDSSIARGTLQTFHRSMSQEGTYSTRIGCTDSIGSTGSSGVITLSFNASKADIYARIEDANETAVDVNISLAQDGAERYSSSDRIHALVVDDGIYNITITPNDCLLQAMSFQDVNITSGLAKVVDIDDPADNQGYSELYAIDPTAISFASATVTATAKANRLYKCTDWNFTEQDCHGNWTEVMAMVPGQDYTFTLTAADPGFAEINVTEAEHLAADYSFISSIYSEVRAKDGVWSEPVYENQFVRATYQSALSNGSVIDIFVRNNNSRNTRVDAYYPNTTSPLLGSSGIIPGQEQWAYIILSNMHSPSSTFDFKVADSSPQTNYLEFDYIHDSVEDGRFFDDFENDSFSTTWTQDAQLDWFRDAARSYSGGSYAAGVDGSATDAWLMKSATDNLTGYEYCELSARIYIEAVFDADEFICVDFSTDGGSTWNRDTGSPNQAGFQDLCVDGDVDAEDTWNHVYYNITGSNLTSDFAFRFRSTVSAAAEAGQVDHVNLTCYYNTAPNVTQASPANGSVTASNNVTFNCSAEDDSGLSNITLYWDYTGSWQANGTDSVSGVSNSTAFTRTGLNNTQILWGCLAYDNAGKSNWSASNWTLTVNYTPPDYDPPNITGVNATYVTNETALITWDTDEASNSSVSYGETLSLGNLSGSDLYVTFHTFPLTGLNGNTTYYYNVTSCDPSGNCNTTGPNNFTTNDIADLVPPQIINVSSESRWHDANINWTSDEFANASLYYGTTPALGSNQSAGMLFINSHSLWLTELLDNTTYYYNVTSCDPSDNCNTTGPNNFTTLFDNNPSVIITRPLPGFNKTYSKPLEIRANITDDTDISIVVVNVTKPDTSIEQFVMQLYYLPYQIVFYNTTLLGRHNITMAATDNYGHVNGTETTYFFVVPDADPPHIYFISETPDPLDRGQNLTVRANATDDSGVVNVWAEIGGSNLTMKYNVTYDYPAFSDGFESGSFSTKGWGTYGAGTPWAVSTTDPANGTYHAEASNTDASSYLEANISTVYYRNITVRYDRKLVGLDDPDDFASEYYDGSSWNYLEHLGAGTANDAGYVNHEHQLPDSASNNAAFAIRFMCNVNAPSEYCRVDNVNVTGTTGTDDWVVIFNTSSLSSGLNYYSVYANDTSGNLASNTSNFTINADVPPYWAGNKTNSSSATRTGQTAYFNVTLYDRIGGAYQIFSFYNGTGWANDTAAAWANMTELEIVRGITATRGMTVSWYWWFNNSVALSNQTDTWSFTVANTVPTHSAPRLNATTESNTTDDELYCMNVSTYDPDMDAVTNTYRWYKNSAVQPTLENFTVIGSGNTTTGENWTCEVTPCDGYGCGTARNSTSLLINPPGDSTPPTSDSPPDQSVELGTLSTITWTLQDDYAPGQYWVERNGTLFAGPSPWISGTPIIIWPNNHFIGNWNYTIYFNDSLGNSGSPDTVTVNVSDSIMPSCSSLITGGSGYPTLINITVDGDMSDWDPVLSNPLNVVTDPTSGNGDADTIQTADRDLVTFAYTWTNETLFFHFRRLDSGANALNLVVYLDQHRDGYMNSTEKVLLFKWTGSNAQYDSSLYNYVPAVPAGDKINGSGYDMPGSITVNKSIQSNVLGGTDPGIWLETSVNWSDIYLAGPTPMNFRVSSSLGVNLPSQVEDNMDMLPSAYPLILFQPDHSGPGVNGTSAYYDHELMNCGDLSDTVRLTNMSSQGWNVSLFYSNGTAITDSNSDGSPDIALLANSYSAVIARIDIPASTAMGTSDTTTITAWSSDSSVSESVTDTTSTGNIQIIPQIRSIYGTRSMTATLNYTVYNYQIFNDTIEINATSSQNWSLRLLHANGSALTDTDGDGVTDLGNMLPSGHKNILLQIIIPAGAANGTEDISTIRINSSVDPALTTTAFSNTTVRDRLTLERDYTRSVGIGSSTYYYLTVTNSWNESDVADLTYNYILNWTTAFYDTGMVSLLSDTDSDSKIDVGSLAPYGGSQGFYAKVTVPSSAAEYQSELTTVYANSSLNTSVHALSRINTTARRAVTYSDDLKTTELATFEVGSTVYVRAHNLLAISNVYFQWIDPTSMVLRISPDIAVSGENYADDFFKTNISHLLGNWTVVVFNSQNDAEIGRADFYVVDTKPPYWKNNKTNASATTRVGQSAYFNITPYENYNASYQIFSFYNGTGWANDTAVPWTNATELSKTRLILATRGMTVRWYWWFNDTSNNINQTDIWSFVVANTPPTAPAQDFPPNDYNFTNPLPSFNWSQSYDADNDPINYTLYITCNGGCSDDNREYNTSQANFTVTSQLNYYGDSNYYYNWSVRAWDGYNYSASSGSRNFTVYTSVILTLVNGTVEFGSKAIGQSDNTTDDSPEPFLLRNDGSSFLDVKLKASDLLWETQTNASRYFQFKAGNRTGEEGAFNYSGSLTDWANVSLSDVKAISYFNYSNATDEAEIDIQIEVPLDETPGTKTAILVFTGEYAG